MAQPPQLPLISFELGHRWKPFVYQQVSNFLELRLVGEVEDVVAAVVQVVAGAPDSAQRGVPGDDSGQGDRFLGLSCFYFWRRAHPVSFRKSDSPGTRTALPGSACPQAKVFASRPVSRFQKP